MVRDLINTPANLLGPVELADFAVSLARHHGVVADVIADDALNAAYPTIAAVGRGSARPPGVATLRWAGSTRQADAPLLSLCGKGVCFDTGGYDLKPSAGMLRMKKDMGGAATMLGSARMIMDADLPIRWRSASAASKTPCPGCDAATRRDPDPQRPDGGDRQHRCRGPAWYCAICWPRHAAEHPALLVDCATLTGAARVALGPDLPALFCNDDRLGGHLLRAGARNHDPLWRLPLWPGYDAWLNSPVADINNVSAKPHAGAIIAALFLQRFVHGGRCMGAYRYVCMERSDRARSSRGWRRRQAMRAVFAGVKERFVAPELD